MKLELKKVLKIPHAKLRQLETTEYNSSLTFISTFNANNPNICDLLNYGENTLAQNKINILKNLKLTYAKWEPTNLKKILYLSAKQLVHLNAYKAGVNTKKQAIWVLRLHIRVVHFKTNCSCFRMEKNITFLIHICQVFF